MSNLANKDKNWKSLKNSELDQNCNITTPELELCYPKNDFQNHPGLNKLLAYRKLKGNDKCNPNPKDPCVLNTDHMVIPSADVIRVYEGATFVRVENDQQTVVCKGTSLWEAYDKALYLNDAIYQQFGVVDALENSTVAIVEAGSYITYLVNPSEEEIALTKEELNKSALADAESQLDCRITNNGSGSCPYDELFVADRSTNIVTIEPGEIFEYIRQNETDWSNAKVRLDASINNYINSNLICVYTNKKYTAYCAKAAYMDNNTGNRDNIYIDFALADNGYNDGTAHSKLLFYDFINYGKYSVEYQYDSTKKQLIPGYIKNNSFVKYPQYSSNKFVPIDTETLIEKSRVVISSNNVPFTKIAISVPLNGLDWLTKGNHQGFSSAHPDQPINPDREDGLYVVEKNTYFVEARYNNDSQTIDKETAINQANELAKAFVKSQIDCTYQNKAWTSNCPDGFTLTNEDNTISTSVTVDEFKYSAISNLAQATLLAKAEADARISACILTNSVVQIFCDRGNNRNSKGEFHSSTLNYKFDQDKAVGNKSYIYSVADIRSGNFNNNPPVNPWPIYIYLNDFDDDLYVYNCALSENETIVKDENDVPAGNCYASASVSLPYYKIDRGYFSSINPNASLLELNKSAIQLAISSIVCQYGNLDLSAISCSSEKFAFLKDKTIGDISANNCLVYMPKSCGPGTIDPKKENCYTDKDGWSACAISTVGPAIEKDTYFSSSPILANTTAAKIQLASRVCLPCDVIGGGGGGGGTVTIKGESSCNCSSNACIFVA